MSCYAVSNNTKIANDNGGLYITTTDVFFPFSFFKSKRNYE